MNIRQKLTYQFSLFSAIILLFFATIIYYFSSSYRKNEFYLRLEYSAFNTAKLLLKVNEVDSFLLKKIEQNTIYLLSDKEIYILDKYHQLIYFSNPLERKDTTGFSIVLENLKFNKIIKGEFEHLQQVAFIYELDDQEYFVISRGYDHLGYKKLYNLLYILIIGFIIFLLFINITGYYFAGKALEPIQKIICQVNKISVLNLNTKVVGGSANDEIAQLAKNFNEMLQRLEKAFHLQQSFVANASHELRTPLTSITGQIEVIMFKDRSVDDYKALISSLHEDITDLNNLVNGLLSLAQSDMDAHKIVFSHIRIDDLLIVALDTLKKRGHPGNMVFDFSGFPDDERFITVLGNEGLLKIAFINVLDNASKFSKYKEVRIKLECFDFYKVKVTIIDNGDGIPKNEISDVFRPFFRGSNTAGYKGHGIGLALAQRIINMHGGTIEIQTNNTGTSVSILLSSLVTI